MKSLSKSLLLFIPLVATLTYAQVVTTSTPNTPFKHIIVIVQENRSPDNLFGSNEFPTAASQTLPPGAALTTSGACSSGIRIELQPMTLGDACDPNHSHENGWLPTYDKGAMDGACTISPMTCDSGTVLYPQYSYVENSDVIPYFQMAQQYGYANFMFQTNQGPSFPAHQFLFSGTSAPIFNDGDSNMFWEWFAAENTTNSSVYGCPGLNTTVPLIEPSGEESYGYQAGYPCYNHNTLVNVLDPTNAASTFTWKYYSQSGPTGLWTAPNAISGICNLNSTTDMCSGAEWNNVIFPDSTNYPNSFSPILTDLGADPNQSQCALPSVAWVIPDGTWSDHGGLEPHGAGPSWVAAIVNAVGGYNNSGVKLAKQCFDTINGQQVPYWQDTAILVTWDDWGGWYDHVLPWRCNTSGTCKGYENGTGGVAGEYVYGFRVPLLVISAYGQQGYISGALPPNGPGEVQPYVHDFGSLLNFIEYALGHNGNSLGEIYSTYHYADYYAPDGPNTCFGAATCPVYSLADFFPSFTTARTFAPFTDGVTYATQCFITPKISSCFGSGFVPTDPDGDASDDSD